MKAKEKLKEFLEKKGASEHFDRAWDVVRNAAFSDHPEVELARAFSPQARAEVMPIVEAYEAEIQTELDAQDRIAAEIQTELDAQDRIAEESNSFDDEAFDEIDCYAVVYSDLIEVTANTTGIGDRLPRIKGRKYTGSRESQTWEFPVEALTDVKRCVDMVFDSKGNRIP